ncbi:hypothetical protein [Cohnella hongkongensis]|uniref:Uncharacterized protein n=1 Tax=Cohnella hongkongensis TaxID=178337 RepID=A0ABV9FFZ5_9BACL
MNLLSLVLFIAFEGAVEEIAARLLAKGLDPAMVEEVTGLTADRISMLKESVH